MSWIRLDTHWPDIADDVWAESPTLHKEIEWRLNACRSDDDVALFIHESRLRCIDDLPREELSGRAIVIR